MTIKAKNLNKAHNILNAVLNDNKTYNKGQAVKSLFPQITLLKKQGMTSHQISTVLQQAGIDIPASSIRKRYSEINQTITPRPSIVIGCM